MSELKSNIWSLYRQMFRSRIFEEAIGKLWQDGLMLAAIEDNDPVVFLEHKLLSDNWLDYMGYGGRKTISFDVPPDGREGLVPDTPVPVAIGKGKIEITGNDVSIISLGIGVHRAKEAAEQLKDKKINTEIIDLRTVSPLDKDLIVQSVKKTGHLIVVDEDYTSFGLSGEIAAICLEAGIKFKYRRVCTDDTIPYARLLENEMLPNVSRIIHAALEVLKK
ncbi:MAG: hypothetical protein GQ561_06810 [Calditrichae bacterium]|nr:hypothetical protein [Calditrichia bacterium]